MGILKSLKKINYCRGCSSYNINNDPWETFTWCTQCEGLRRSPKKEIMTPDALYEQGYEDGKAGKAMNASQLTDPNYTMGFEDGKGDRVIERPVEDEYTSFTDAPAGFKYAGKKRVPQPFEFYLSKGGSATFLTRERKNNQERHILTCSTCQHSDATRCFHHNIKGRG